MENVFVQLGSTMIEFIGIANLVLCLILNVKYVVMILLIRLWLMDQICISLTVLAVIKDTLFKEEYVLLVQQ